MATDDTPKPGMQRVTKDEFFAVIGGLDVHPSQLGRYDDTAKDYRTDWKLRDGRIVGHSFAGQYWVRL